MANTGNIFPGTGESVDRAGLTAWTSPGNVVSDNTTDATCNGAGSDYLVARNFDFSSIPAGSTINGILVRVEASEHSGGTEPLLAQLQDEVAALAGSSKSTSNEGPISGTAKAVYTYGSTSDAWDVTLTEAMVKDPDFGVRLWFATSHDVRIDFVTMAVEYTVPAPVSGSGTPQAATATADGVGVTVNSGSGSPQAATATADGAGSVIGPVSGSGSPQAATATADGAAVTTNAGQGAAQAASATADGSGFITYLLVGMVQASGATAIGLGTVESGEEEEFETSAAERTDIYILESDTGLVKWVDYIPVVRTGTKPGRSDLAGCRAVRVLGSIVNKVAWVDYIPVFVVTETANGMRYENDGFVPIDSVTP